MRILVVEDEPGIANFLKQGLEEESFQVDVADNGVKGLELALSGQYNLLLLDWMLPGISGLELCEEFRKKHAQTPIIFLTAKDTLAETISGLQTGANDYIKKPFHFEELLERIKVQLRSNNERKTRYTLGDIVLDVDTVEVTKSGGVISLTQKEFDLLAYLIKNKGKVCRRTQIIEDVWDIHFDYNSSVIDVYINSLRKKLQLNTDEGSIQTIRGVGYMAKEL